MTQTIGDAPGNDESVVDAPQHCGDPMTLRETSYRGFSYGMIAQAPAGPDVELVWACACGFQLSPEEPAELAHPLPPALHRVAAAAADLESLEWHLDQLTEDLEAAVVRAANAGNPITVVADAAHLDPRDVRELAAGDRPLVDVG
ncbi:type 2 periplasmic-binding domain-containing protein [Arthrobacter sp. TMS2-4]